MYSALKISQYLLVAYAFLIPFQRLFYFPGLGYKLQLPELVFGGLALTVLRLLSGNILRKVWPAALLPIWAWMTAIYHQDANAWQEAAGLTYLFAMTWIAGSIIVRSEKGTTKRILKVFVWGVVLQCVLCIVSFVLKLNLIHTPLIMTYRDYPLLGDIYRIQGFTSHPIALGNLCITALVFTLLFKRKKRWLTGSILMLGLMLTASKALLIAASAFFFFICFWSEKLNYIKTRLEKSKFSVEQTFRQNNLYSSKSLIYFASGLLLLGLHLYLTHFTLPMSREGAVSTSRAVFWNDEIVAERGDKKIYGTSYYFLKKAAIAAVVSHPLMGVGGGNFNDYNVSKYAQDINKVHLATYDPHSLYFGTAAEFGLPGLLLLLILIFLIWQSLLTSLQKRPQNLMLTIMGAILLFYMLEGISTDIINNRQIWLLAGLAVGYVSALDSFKNRNQDSGNQLTDSEFDTDNIA